MLEEVKPLYGYGFAIHLLGEKSKIPLKKGWTIRDKEPWKSLEKGYKPGMNVGVRLGEVSKIDGKFLAVIDCDVKSKDKKHLAEMNERLKELLGDKITPCVLSGRGNGSKHFYVLTAAPLKPGVFAQSLEKVKVLMPSTRVSKAEMAGLTDSEREEGYRLRAAWEISLMGEGQQVVLPPSIHPDSGKPYKWVKPFKAVSLMTFEPPVVEARGKRLVKEPLKDFKVVEYDLFFTGLKDDTIDKVMTGVGVQDRSASLFGVVNEMLKCGWKRDQVLSCLTDKENYLSGCCYDHAKTDDRETAATWLYNFTFRKAKKNVFLEEEFSEVIEDVSLGDEEAKDQSMGLVGEENTEWKSQLRRAKQTNKIKPNMFNVDLILKNVLGREDYIKGNELSNDYDWNVTAPFASHIKVGSQFRNGDDVVIKMWFEEKFKFEVSKEMIFDTLTAVKCKNSYHPIRDWFNTLKWDGVSRIDTWLEDYLGVNEKEKEAVRLIGRRFLIAMVARVFRPGCKFDHCLVLEGLTGAGKSTFGRILVGDDKWFSDTELPIGKVDGFQMLQGVWLYEMAELSSISKAELRSVKNFITSQTDKYRPSYGKVSQAYPRQVVFYGTTNEDIYLRDPTGDRRWWPVKVKTVKFDKLKKDREQLFAEALELFKSGERFYNTREEEEKYFEPLRTPRKITNDLFEEPLRMWLEENADFTGKRFKMHELIEAIKHEPFMEGRRVTNHEMHQIMKNVGLTFSEYQGYKWWFPESENSEMGF